MVCFLSGKVIFSLGMITLSKYKKLLKKKKWCDTFNRGRQERGVKLLVVMSNAQVPRA